MSRSRRAGTRGGRRPVPRLPRSPTSSSVLGPPPPTSTSTACSLITGRRVTECASLLRRVTALATAEGIPCSAHTSAVARPVLERARFVVDHTPRRAERAGVMPERFAIHRVTEPPDSARQWRSFRANSADD